MSRKFYVADEEIWNSIEENLVEISMGLKKDKQEVMKEALEFFYEQYYRKLIREVM